MQLVPVAGAAKPPRKVRAINMIDGFEQTFDDDGWAPNASLNENVNNGRRDSMIGALRKTAKGFQGPAFMLLDPYVPDPNKPHWPDDPMLSFPVFSEKKHSEILRQNVAKHRSQGDRPLQSLLSSVQGNVDRMVLAKALAADVSEQLSANTRQSLAQEAIDAAKATLAESGSLQQGSPTVTQKQQQARR